MRSACSNVFVFSLGRATKNLRYVISDKEIYLSHFNPFCHSFYGDIAVFKLLILIGYGSSPVVFY